MNPITTPSVLVEYVYPESREEARAVETIGRLAGDISSCLDNNGGEPLVVEGRDGQDARFHRVLTGALVETLQEPVAQVYCISDDTENPAKLHRVIFGGGHGHTTDEELLRENMTRPTVIRTVQGAVGAGAVMFVVSGFKQSS